MRGISSSCYRSADDAPDSSTGGLLVLARAQTDQESLELEPVEVKPILGAVAASVTLRRRRKTDDSVRVPGRSPRTRRGELIEQIVVSLADNAHRHAGDREIVLRTDGTATSSPSRSATRCRTRAGSRDRVFDGSTKAGEAAKDSDWASRS